MTARRERSGRRAFVVGAALLFARPSSAFAAAALDTGPIVLGTSTPGGGFALYGETLERVVNARAGRTLVRARPTRGTAENLDLLRSGTLDAALIQGTAASALFAGGGSDDDLAILGAMYPSPGLLAVPAASPVRTLEDTRGARVVFGVRASGLVTLGRQVYAGIGLDIDRDLEAIYVDEAAASPRIVLDGGAVGLWGAGEGWPGFVALATAPGGARFVGPGAAQIPRIVARYPLLQPMTVAPGAYPGIDAPLATVGSVNLIVSRADLDDARARAFVDAFAAGLPALTAALPQAAYGTRENARRSAPRPEALHRVLRTP